MDEEIITHVWVGPNFDSIMCELEGGDRYLYRETRFGVVRVRERNFVDIEVTNLTNTWAELLAKYQSHPANWQVKAHQRMMALYQAKREEEARKRLETDRAADLALPASK